MKPELQMPEYAERLMRVPEGRTKWNST